MFDRIKDIILHYFPTVSYCDLYDIASNKYGTLKYCIVQDIFNSFKFPISNKTYKIKTELDSLLPVRYFKYGTINFINFFKKDKSFNDYMVKLNQFEDVLIDLNCKKMINELNKYKKNEKELSLRSFLAQYNKDCISKDELINLFNYYINQFEKFIFTYNEFISSFYDDQINILKEKLKPYNINNLYLLYNNETDNPYPITYFSKNNIIMSVLYGYVPLAERTKILKTLNDIEYKYPFISLYQMIDDAYKTMVYMSVYKDKGLSTISKIDSSVYEYLPFSRLSENEELKIVSQLYTNNINLKNNQLIYPAYYMQLPMIPSIIPLIGFEYNNRIYKISINIGRMHDISEYNSIIKLKKENINIFEYNFNNINMITCFNENTAHNILHDSLSDLFNDLKNTIPQYKKCAAHKYNDKIKYSLNKTKTFFNSLNLKFYNIETSDLYYILQSAISNDCDEFQSKLYQLLYYLVWDSIIFDEDVYRSICKSIKRYIFKHSKIMSKINLFCAKYDYKPKINIFYDDSKYTAHNFKIRHIFNEDQIDQLFNPNINLCYDNKKINVSMTVTLYPADSSKTMDLQKLFSNVNPDNILYNSIINSYAFSKNNKKDMKKLRCAILQCCYSYYPKNVIIKIVNTLYDKYLQNMCDIMKKLSNNNRADNFEDFFTQFEYYMGNELSQGMIKYKKL